MTPDEHRERHEALHRALDELLADFLMQQPRPTIRAPILELMEWSYHQTVAPTAIDDTVPLHSATAALRKPSVELAKRAIRHEALFASYFPAGPAAREMAELASDYLLRIGVLYWLSPSGDAITCSTCRLTSHNPHDVAERYCGRCHVFFEGQQPRGTQGNPVPPDA